MWENYGLKTEGDRFAFRYRSKLASRFLVVCMLLLHSCHPRCLQTPIKPFPILSVALDFGKKYIYFIFCYPSLFFTLYDSLTPSVCECPEGRGGGDVASKSLYIFTHDYTLSLQARPWFWLFFFRSLLSTNLLHNASVVLVFLPPKRTFTCFFLYAITMEVRHSVTYFYMRTKPSLLSFLSFLSFY